MSPAPHRVRAAQEHAARLETIATLFAILAGCTKEMRAAGADAALIARVLRWAAEDLESEGSGGGQ